MEYAVYKPYKKRRDTWNSVTDRQKDVDGRKLLCIEIGKKQILDEETQALIKEEYLYEYVFLDILRALFIRGNSYRTKITVGYEPKLVISYDGRLVIHNDRISEYVISIMHAMAMIDEELEVRALVNAVLNEKCGERYSADFHKLINRVNECCAANFPPDLIYLVLKEHLCESKRVLGRTQEKIHYMSYENLLAVAAKVLINRGKKAPNRSEENDLKEELFYRFIQGELA